MIEYLFSFLYLQVNKSINSRKINNSSMKLFDRFESNRDYSIVIIRSFLGVVFLLHGLQKFGYLGGPGIVGFAVMLKKMGFTLELFFSYLVGIVELTGGVAILSGFLTRYASIALAIDMIIAVFMIHLNNGFFFQNGGYEYPLILFLICIMFVYHGAGRFSVERFLWNRNL